MYPNKFNNINEVGKYLTDNIEYNPIYGFSFAGIKLGMSFDEVIAILGEPEIKSIASDQQQTMQYNALIDHPTEGTRTHHKLNLLFWAFNREPFSIIKFHFNYFSYGAYSISMKEFIDDFLKGIINKFGKPKKKTFRNRKEEVLYETDGYRLSIWRNTEGVRITLK